MLAQLSRDLTGRFFWIPRVDPAWNSLGGCRESSHRKTMANQLRDVYNGAGSDGVIMPIKEGD